MFNFWSSKPGSGSALKPMRIQSTGLTLRVCLRMLAFKPGNSVGCSLARQTGKPLGYISATWPISLIFHSRTLYFKVFNSRLVPVRTDINFKKKLVLRSVFIANTPRSRCRSHFFNRNQPHFVALHKHNLNYFFLFNGHSVFLDPESLFH